MECRRCAACDRAFRPHTQVPHQRYCALAACQRERRRRWQQSKLHADADYRANQRQAQRAWADGHGEYWREYRAKHPDYTDRNRLEQRRRDRARRSARLAKMDASRSIHAVSSGTYRLLPEGDEDLAKKDAWKVKITVISRDFELGGEADAILQREDVIGAAGPAC
jgi:hypothetical protein